MARELGKWMVIIGAGMLLAYLPIMVSEIRARAKNDWMERLARECDGQRVRYPRPRTIEDMWPKRPFLRG